ncbi:unnamed protein product [Pylaiella littoralis]
MFHAVSQMAGDDLGSPGTGAHLPMFREQQQPSSSRSVGRRRRKPSNEPRRRDHQVDDGGGGSSGGSSLSPVVSTAVTPAASAGAAAGAAAASSTAGPSPRAVIEMRPLHLGRTAAAPRRRKSGHVSSSRSAGAAAAGNNKSSPPVAFAGPDGLDTDGGFGHAGTFRWDATVADAATAQQDELADDEEEEHALEREEGGGSGGGGSGRGSRSGSRVGPAGGGGALGGSWSGGDMKRKRSGRGPLLCSRDLNELVRSGRPWYIMKPESKIHQMVDHFGDFLTLYVLVAIPLFVSFQHIENMHAEDWHAFNFVIDVFFLVDFAARFLTAYHDEYANRVVYEPMAIARNYSKGLLVFDLIASIPLTMVLGVHTFSISNKVARLARIPQTMRLIRSIKMLSEEAEKTYRKNILLATYNLVKVVISILLVMHWVACGWHLLADLEDADLSWIVKDGLEDAPASQLYVTSVYWTVTTLSTVGYGDIFASTIAERTYCILVMLTGATMYALAIGAVSHIITTVVARHSHSRRIERHAEAFIQMHSLPQYLASEIMRTLNISGETNQMLERRAQNTLELLPSGVRTSTLLCIYRPQIARMGFFRNRKDTHPVFVTSVMRSMHDHIYPKAGATILLEDAGAEEVLFVVRGRAVISRRGVEVGRLSAGSCFGATAALHCGGLRRESVTCVTDCEMYTIEGKALRRIARAFPGPMSELKAESERSLFAIGRRRREAGGETLPGSTSEVCAIKMDRSTGASKRDAGDLVLSKAAGAGERDSLASPSRTVVPTPAAAAAAAAVGDDPTGVFGDPKSVVQPSLAGEGGSGCVRVGERFSQRSIRTMARCLAEAARVEVEVWDQLHLLTDSLGAMRQLLREGREAQDRVCVNVCVV